MKTPQEGVYKMNFEQLMNDATLTEELQKNPELNKAYHQEKLILEVTDIVSKLMKKKKVNKSELAKRLNVGKSYVTQLLDGTSNMTLGTISDVFVALDSMMIVHVGPLSLKFGQCNDEYKFEEGNRVVQSEISQQTISNTSLGKSENYKLSMVA